MERNRRPSLAGRGRPAILGGREPAVDYKTSGIGDGGSGPNRRRGPPESHPLEAAVGRRESGHPPALGPQQAGSVGGVAAGGAGFLGGHLGGPLAALARGGAGGG